MEEKCINTRTKIFLFSRSFERYSGEEWPNFLTRTQHIFIFHVIIDKCYYITELDRFKEEKKTTENQN